MSEVATVFSRFEIGPPSLARSASAAMGILERIATIELEMNRTQKNKATEGHLGALKAKLAALRRKLMEPGPGAGGRSASRI